MLQRLVGAIAFLLVAVVAWNLSKLVVLAISAVIGSPGSSDIRVGVASALGLLGFVLWVAMMWAAGRFFRKIARARKKSENDASF